MHIYIITSLVDARYGPLIRYWTMRYEAKHSFFKRSAQSMGNFNNIPYSLAMRHQHLQCYFDTTQDRELPGMGFEVGPGISPHSVDSYY